MRHGLLALLCVPFFAVPGRGQSLPKGVEVLRDDARILILRAPSADVVGAHKAAIVVPLEDGPNRKTGEAYWSGDASAAPATGRIVLVEPREARGPLPAAAPTPGPTVGMSFTPIFENERAVVWPSA